MNRTSRLLVVVGLIVFSISGVSFSAAPADRPNIVWIISDDLGPEPGCYGYSDVATANVDRLAASGTRYTHAFAADV